MESNRYAIALDLGTTAIKASLVDEDGRVLSVASYECTLETPGPNMVEQDASAWSTHACEVIRQAARGVDPASILGVGITSQGISFVLTDEAFNPLHTAVSWLDTRCGEQCARILADDTPEAFFRMTGKSGADGYTLPGMLWMFEHHPELREKAKRCLMPMDFAIAFLTGKAVSDRTMWAGSLMLELSTQSWNEPMIRRYGIDPSILPSLQDTGSIAGGLTARAAELTGLLPGTPVIGAGQDQKTAAYGASIRPNMSTLSLGTAGAMETLTANCSLDPTLGVSVCPYMTRESWIIETCINTAGAAIKWVKNNVFPDLSYAEMNELAWKAPAGSHGAFFLPFLTAPGTPHCGKAIDGAYRALSLAVDRADLARALYEGLAYELRLNTDAVQKSGVKLTEIAAFGGASRSEPFCRIFASVLELPVKKYATEEMTGVGAAKMVFAAHGGDLARFDRGATGGTTVYEPDAALSAAYRPLFTAYQQMLARC